MKIKYLNLKLGSSDLKAYIRSIPPYWTCRCRTFNEEMNERHVTHVSHGKQPVMLGEVCTVIVIKTAIKEANICEGLVRFCLFVTYWGILKQIFLLLRHFFIKNNNTFVDFINERIVICIIGVLLHLLVMMSLHFKICNTGQTIMEK